MEALQEVAEEHVVRVLEEANMLVEHAGRSTMLPKDMLMARHIRDKRFWI